MSVTRLERMLDLLLSVSGTSQAFREGAHEERSYGQISIGGFEPK